VRSLDYGIVIMIMQCRNDVTIKKFPGEANGHDNEDVENGTLVMLTGRGWRTEWVYSPIHVERRAGLFTFPVE